MSHDSYKGSFELEHFQEISPISFIKARNRDFGEKLPSNSFSK
jgi:hypothetical protein